MTANRPLTLALLALLACNKAEDSAVCTEMGCEDGFTIELNRQRWEAGTWTITLTSDGVNTTCTATIPLDEANPGACDRTGYRLETSGSALDVSEQALTAVHIPRIDLAQVNLVVEHDGSEVFADSLAPTYETLQPNGADCDPTCTYASTRLTLP